MWCVSTGNKIGYEGANALSQCLTHLTQLIYLDLGRECMYYCVTWCVWYVMCVTWCDVMWCDVVTDNNIECEGANALSQCLPHLTQLTYLDLRRKCVHVGVLLCVMWCDVSTDNNIEYEGVKALSQCLTHLTQLTDLDLRRECVYIDAFYLLLRCDVMWCVSTGNHIGDEGAKELIQCLPHMTELTELNLTGECALIGECDVCDVCDVCESTDNSVGDKVANALKQQCLPSLIIDYNK